VGKLKAETEYGKIADWYITKGGEKISEIEFLNTIGRTDEAKQIEDSLTWNRYTMIFGTAVVIVAAITGANKMELDKKYVPNTETIIALLGAILCYASVPPKHYLKYSEAGHQIDLYNHQLAEKLGLGNQE